MPESRPAMSGAFPSSFISRALCGKLGLPLDCRPGEPLDQKFPDQMECLSQSSQLPHAAKEAVGHPLPNIKPRIDSFCDRARQMVDLIATPRTYRALRS